MKWMTLIALVVLVGCSPPKFTDAPHPQAAQIADCVEHTKLRYKVETFEPMPVSNARLTEQCTWRVEQGVSYHTGTLRLEDWR